MKTCTLEDFSTTNFWGITHRKSYQNKLFTNVTIIFTIVEHTLSYRIHVPNSETIFSMQALIQSSESDLDLFLLDVCECDRVECLESTLRWKKKKTANSVFQLPDMLNLTDKATDNLWSILELNKYNKITHSLPF